MGCVSLGMKQAYKTALPKSCNLGNSRTGWKRGITGEFGALKQTLAPSGMGTRLLQPCLRKAGHSRVGDCRVGSPFGKSGDVAANTLVGRCFLLALLCKPWADTLRRGQGAWASPATARSVKKLVTTQKHESSCAHKSCEGSGFTSALGFFHSSLIFAPSRCLGRMELVWPKALGASSGLW